MVDFNKGLRGDIRVRAKGKAEGGGAGGDNEGTEIVIGRISGEGGVDESLLLEG